MENFCKICRKEEKKLGMFAVKDELWESYCKKVGISRLSVVCIECYEKEMGPIKIEDLKTSYDELGRHRELPGNFWLIKKLARKTDVKTLMSRIPLVKEGIRKEFLMKLGKYQSPEQTSSWVKEHKEFLNWLKQEIEKREA